MNQTDSKGYLALPDSGQGPGVLVLHAWWGLNDVIKEVCQQLADEGFFAFAPDLYDGEVATTIAEAEALSSKLDSNKVISQISRALDYLSDQVKNEDQPLGVIGFSLGASYALRLSSADPERVRAVVLFYGVGDADLSQSKAAYLGHFAENDSYEPAKYVDELEKNLKSAGKVVTFYRYQGVGHWFFEPDRVDVYNEPLAIIAWERTAAFLHYHLSSSSVR